MRTTQLSEEFREKANARMTATEEMIDARIQIVTPENIAFQYTIAGPLRRLPAFLLDVFFGVLIFVSALASFVMGILWFRLVPPSWMASAAFGLVFILYFALVWFYGAYFETFWNGQTPGKRIYRLRVLGENGRPVTASQAVLRNLLRWVDVLPFVALFPMQESGERQMQIYLPVFAVGLLAMIFSRKYQRLGDIAAGTMVVLEDRVYRAVLTRYDIPAVRAAMESIPADYRVGSRLATALAAYMERRTSMSEARREEAASKLATSLRPRLRISDQVSSDVLLSALYLRTFHGENPDWKSRIDRVRAPSGGDAGGHSNTPLRRAEDKKGAGTGAFSPRVRL